MKHYCSLCGKKEKTFFRLTTLKIKKPYNRISYKMICPECWISMLQAVVKLNPIEENFEKLTEKLENYLRQRMEDAIDKKISSLSGNLDKFNLYKRMNELEDKTEKTKLIATSLLEAWKVSLSMRDGVIIPDFKTEDKKEISKQLGEIKDD